MPAPSERAEFMVSEPVLSAENFAKLANVSRETMARFDIYLQLLVKWQAKINLVGPATLADPWRRHFLDSAQLFSLVPTGTACLYDLGSGAGFPGLVLAILGVPQVRLIESDQRKGAFLTAVAQALDLKPPHLIVDSRRIEAITGLPPAPIITARAFAPLERILSISAGLRDDRTLYLLLKGAKAQDELTEAARTWHMTVTHHPSRTDPDARILALTDIKGQDS